MREMLFIDGAWCAPSSSMTFPVIDPATEAVFHEAPAGSERDIDRAVTAARHAFDEGPWPKTSGSERAVYLRAIAGSFLGGSMNFPAWKFVTTVSRWLKHCGTSKMPRGFTFYATLAEELDNRPDERIALADKRFSSKAVTEPVGVVGAIIPWNYSLLMASWKIAPALAAGGPATYHVIEWRSLGMGGR